MMYWPPITLRMILSVLPNSAAAAAIADGLAAVNLGSSLTWTSQTSGPGSVSVDGVAESDASVFTAFTVSRFGMWACWGMNSGAFCAGVELPPNGLGMGRLVLGATYRGYEPGAT